jgi:hypothetical protein
MPEDPKGTTSVQTEQRGVEVRELLSRCVLYASTQRGAH